jgi:hypothetical protein
LLNFSERAPTAIHNAMPVASTRVKHWGDAEVERRRREDRGAVGARGWGLGRGLPLPRRLGGLGSVVSSPAGSGAEPQPPTILVQFGRERMTLVALKI